MRRKKKQKRKSQQKRRVKAEAKKKQLNQVASFSIAYNTYIKPNEGGYANVVGDKGGETYGGISRRYWPAWPGWPTIDAKKKNYASGVIPNNTHFADLDGLQQKFYSDWWTNGYFDKINSQDVANLLFDYNVNSASTAIKAVQKLVGTTADGAMGPKTVEAINKADASKLYADLLANRKQLYANLVANDSTQQQFWNGWMSRLAKFPQLLTPTNTLVGLGVAVAIVFAIVLYTHPAHARS